MTPEEPIQVAPTRVSILARIVPALSYALPAFGAALTALFFMRVLYAMRIAESAGVGAVAGGMWEANIAIVVTLYLAIFLGFAGIIVNVIRRLTTTTTASPAGWLFLAMGAVGLAPTLTLWRAQSILLDVLMGVTGRQAGVSEVIGEINVFLYLTLGLAAIACFVLLLISVIPLPAALKAKSKWSPAIFLGLMELIMIGLTAAYHVRTYYFYQAMINERF